MKINVSGKAALTFDLSVASSADYEDVADVESPNCQMSNCLSVSKCVCLRKSGEQPPTHKLIWHTLVCQIEVINNYIHIYKHM